MFGPINNSLSLSLSLSLGLSHFFGCSFFNLTLSASFLSPLMLLFMIVRLLIGFLRAPKKKTEPIYIINWIIMFIILYSAGFGHMIRLDCQTDGQTDRQSRPVELNTWRTFVHFKLKIWKREKSRCVAGGKWVESEHVRWQWSVEQVAGGEGQLKVGIFLSRDKQRLNIAIYVCMNA